MLGLHYGVPKSGSILVFGGGLWRKDNVWSDHAALLCIVTALAVILAIQFLPCSLGSGRDNRPPRAPFDLTNMEMEQGQSIILLLVNYAADQSGNFRQGKDLLHQSTEGRLAHAAYLRGHAFHIGPSDDKPVVSLLPLALGVVADAVFQSVLLVLVLLHLGGGFGTIFFQFLA